MEKWTKEEIIRASKYWFVYYDGKFGKDIFLVWELGKNANYLIASHYDVCLDEISSSEYNNHINTEKVIELHMNGVNIHNYLAGICKNTPKIRAN